TRHGRSAKPAQSAAASVRDGLVTTFYTYLQLTPSCAGVPCRPPGSRLPGFILATWDCGRNRLLCIEAKVATPAARAITETMPTSRSGPPRPAPPRRPLRNQAKREWLAGIRVIDVMAPIGMRKSFDRPAKAARSG